jgi:prevent-host-death family protein
MAFSVRDIIPLTQARARLSELADAARGGEDKIITKNGESYVALISADKLAYFQQLERERLHLLFLEDARQGFEDIAAGRTGDAMELIARLKREYDEENGPASP